MNTLANLKNVIEETQVILADEGYKIDPDGTIYVLPKQFSCHKLSGPVLPPNVNYIVMNDGIYVRTHEDALAVRKALWEHYKQQAEGMLDNPCWPY